MIKLIACDLDGTLLNSSMEISDANVQAIKRAQENGIEFMVASGRAPHESQPMLKEYGIDCGFINLNGGLVFDTAGNLIVKNPFEAGNCQEDLPPAQEGRLLLRTGYQQPRLLRRLEPADYQRGPLNGGTEPNADLQGGCFGFSQQAGHRQHPAGAKL
jgi:hypothetical protein